MAFIDIPGWPISYPPVGSSNANSAFAAGLRIDAATEKVAFILRAPRAGNLNRVGFRFATVTQAPANGLTVSLQTVDATNGDPDGTQDQTRLVASGSIVSNTWVTTGLITSDGTDTGTKRTVTQGEVFAVVIEFASFSAGDNVDVTPRLTGPWEDFGRGSIYADFFTVSWAHQTTTSNLNIAVQYDDGVWAPLYYCVPAATTLVENFSNATNPDERGMKFTCPVAMRAVGFIFHGTAAATNGTGTLHLWDVNDVELARASLDPDIVSVAANTGPKFYPFDAVASAVELETDQVYRVTLKATGTSNVTVNGYIPSTSAFQSASPWGENAVRTTRNNAAGAWTDSVNGSVLAIGLLIDAIDPIKGGPVDSVMTWAPILFSEEWY
ncbi:MAG: hypothetical protein ACREBG_23970 [Pyrinomonadaceae bacterium]